MKKTYIIPRIDKLFIQCEMPLAASGVMSDDIGYGGVDEGGTLDPDAKFNNFSFDYNSSSEEDDEW